MSAARVLIIFALGALVASCQDSIRIRVSGPLSAPVFSMSPGAWLQTRTLCLTHVVVTSIGPDGQETVFWSAATEDLACLPATRVVYGRAPDGFRTLAAAKALSTGVTYWASASGHGWTGVQGFRFDAPDRVRMLDRRQAPAGGRVR